MGRKKEKRPQGYGRKMKLDLWNQEPEPKKAEIDLEGDKEKETDQTHELELVSTEDIKSDSEPSRASNPLSLLGQYSDEEEEEEEEEENQKEEEDEKEEKEIIKKTETQTQTILEFENLNSSEQMDDQVLNFLSELEDSGLLKEENENNNKTNNDINNNEKKISNDIISSVSPSIGLDESNEVKVKPSTSAIYADIEGADISRKEETVDDVAHDSENIYAYNDDNYNVNVNDHDNAMHDINANVMDDGWTAVLDESSNEYYYWNTQTGETSWNVPERRLKVVQSDEKQIKEKTNQVVDEELKDVERLESVEKENEKRDEKEEEERGMKEEKQEKKEKEEERNRLDGEKGLDEGVREKREGKEERKGEAEAEREEEKGEKEGRGEGNSIEEEKKVEYCDMLNEVGSSVEINSLQNLLSSIKQLSNNSFDDIAILIQLAIEIKLRIIDFRFLSSQNEENSTFLSYLKNDIVRIEKKMKEYENLINKPKTLNPNMLNFAPSNSPHFETQSLKFDEKGKSLSLGNGFKIGSKEKGGKERKIMEKVIKEIKENKGKEEKEGKEEKKIRTWRDLRKPSSFLQTDEEKEKKEEGKKEEVEGEKEREMEGEAGLGEERDGESDEERGEEEKQTMKGLSGFEKEENDNFESIPSLMVNSEALEKHLVKVETSYTDTVKMEDSIHLISQTDTETDKKVNSYPLIQVSESETVLTTEVEKKEEAMDPKLLYREEGKEELEEGEVLMDIDDSNENTKFVSYQSIDSNKSMASPYPLSLNPPYPPIPPEEGEYIPLPPHEELEEALPPLPSEPYAFDSTNVSYFSLYQLQSQSTMSSFLPSSSPSPFYPSETILFPLQDASTIPVSSLYSSQSNSSSFLSSSTSSSSSSPFVYSSLQTPYLNSLTMAETSINSNYNISSSSSFSSSIPPPTIYSAPPSSSLSLKSQFSSFVEKESENFILDDFASISSFSSSSFSSSSSLSTSIPTATKKMEKGKISKKRNHPEKKTNTLKVNKKLSMLVNKWQAVKEEMYEKEEEEEEEDGDVNMEALEQKRLKEIEDWRLSQIRSGEAEENANFQPLNVDWREKIKKAKRAKMSSENKIKGDDKKASPVFNAGKSKNSEKKAPSKASSDSKPDLDSLSKNLPTGWQAFWDANSKDVYYGNVSTKETSWERPQV